MKTKKFHRAYLTTVHVYFPIELLEYSSMFSLKVLIDRTNRFQTNIFKICVPNFQQLYKITNLEYILRIKMCENSLLLGLKNCSVDVHEAAT